MKLIPLGGAEEVGATCTLVEVGGHRLLIDAGIRLNQPDALPDLGRISDFGGIGIEAILVTHAHTDHTGALPVVHRAYPNIPVYATPGTQAIVNVLFNDALNIMKSRYEVDREIPLYNRELVNSLFSRMEAVQLGQTIKLFGGAVAATFFPAGHILGAACIGLESDGANGSGVESAFISGDISVTPQLTVGGMLPPVSVDPRFHPQVVMVESTYGNRRHADRATEERRMVETVAEVVEGGGRVLIPAFAVGRAQEVLLILASAMARQLIRPFPVWVDGMVRSVCSVYTQHPFDLAAAVRKQILKQGNPFFGESVMVGKAADFMAINKPEERQRLAESGTPGCIVASSGMLSGGPSAFYARYIARESKSAIFITGYQDEESPGRALLQLAEATDPAQRVLRLEGESVPVECLVGKYSLSAHVDAGEVASLIEQLNPQETVLVHGAGGAREALSDLLMQEREERRVYLPRASDELTFAGRKRRLFRTQSSETLSPVQPTTHLRAADADTNTAATTTNTDSISSSSSSSSSISVSSQAVSENGYGLATSGLPTEAAQLVALRQYLIDELGEKSAFVGRTLTIQQVAQGWFSFSHKAVNERVGEDAPELSEPTLSGEEYTRLRTLLGEKASGFLNDPRRPFLYRLQKQPPATLIKVKSANLTQSLASSEADDSDSANKVQSQVADLTPALPLHQQAALQVVDEVFPPALAQASGLYKRGAIAATHHLKLHFHFPTPAARQYAAQLEQIATRSGWPVELNVEPNQDALIRRTIGLVSEWDWQLAAGKTPSLYLAHQQVKIALDYLPAPESQPAPESKSVAANSPAVATTTTATVSDIATYGYGTSNDSKSPTQLLEELKQTFTEQTGYRLVVELPIGWPYKDRASEAGRENGNNNTGTLQSRNPVKKRLEINQAFAFLDQQFKRADVRLLKSSLKQGRFIELSFVTVQIGYRHKVLIEWLSEQIGWPLEVNPQANQQLLQQEAQNALVKVVAGDVDRGLEVEAESAGGDLSLDPGRSRGEWAAHLIRKVSINQERQRVELKLDSRVRAVGLDEAAVADAFRDATGWELVVLVNQAARRNLVPDVEVETIGGDKSADDRSGGREGLPEELASLRPSSLSGKVPAEPKDAVMPGGGGKADLDAEAQKRARRFWEFYRRRLLELLAGRDPALVVAQRLCQSDRLAEPNVLAVRELVEMLGTKPVQALVKQSIAVYKKAQKQARLYEKQVKAVQKAQRAVTASTTTATAKGSHTQRVKTEVVVESEEELATKSTSNSTLILPATATNTADQSASSSLTEFLPELVTPAPSLALERVYFPSENGTLVAKRDGSPRSVGGVFFFAVREYVEKELGQDWQELRIPSFPRGYSQPPTPIAALYSQPLAKLKRFNKPTNQPKLGHGGR